MKTFTGSTLGLAAALTWMSVAGPVRAQDQTDTNTAAATASPAPSPVAATEVPYSSPMVTPKDNLPVGVQPSSPLAQVIRLLQAGIDQAIIQSYITNSASTFNLDSDRIIYLTDLGAPTSVVSLMMQRDQSIQQQIAASQTAATPPEPTPTTDSTATYATDTTPPPPTENADPVVTAPPQEVTVNYFYDTLTPYGNWVDVDGYGRCWRPSVTVYDVGWQPYGNRGRWVSTDCGWYWQSDYAWGSTFHYGRWFRDARFGWCWWPDTVWAPSWVTWRYNDDYCGWAPLPPHCIYAPNAGFLFRGNGVSVSFDFGLGVDDYVFVSSGRFCDPHPFRYRCPNGDIGRVYAQSTVINDLNTRDHDGHHFVYNGGLPPQHFQQFAATPIHTVPVRSLPNPYAPHPGHGEVPGIQAGGRGFENHPGGTTYRSYSGGNYNPTANNTAPGYGHQNSSSANFANNGGNGTVPNHAFNNNGGSTAKFGAPRQNDNPREVTAARTSLQTHTLPNYANGQATTQTHYHTAGNQYVENQYSAPANNINATRPTPTPAYSAPPPAHAFSAPTAPQHYEPAPAPQPHYSAPAPEQHYSAPAPEPHYSAPAPQPSNSSGGGGHSGGGGSGGGNNNDKHH